MRCKKNEIKKKHFCSSNKVYKKKGIHSKWWFPLIRICLMITRWGFLLEMEFHKKKKT